MQDSIKLFQVLVITWTSVTTALLIGKLTGIKIVLVILTRRCNSILSSDFIIAEVRDMSLKSLYSFNLNVEF